MTRLLALDTSGAACSVALLDGDTIDECFELAPRDHTRLILPMVDSLLQRHKLRLTELDGIAFGCGPGSFTGLRICAGVVQGLAYGAGLPVLAVSSLAAVARGYFARGDNPAADIALACMDARMGELYFGAFERVGSGVVLLGSEQLVTPEQLHLGQFLAPGTRPAALGSGWQYLAQIAGATAESFSCIDMDCLPRAGHIAQLGLAKLEAGDTLSADQVEPAYLREQVAWKKTGQQ
jgi:tRNA threonylcarbamoyladenosine biosynthesis protein TsaB